MLDKLKLDDFQERIGETFKVTPQEGDAFELELRRADATDVGDAKAWAKEHGRAPFSLLFHSRLPDHTPQQIFGVKHDDLGEFELFLVPIGPDAEGHRYEAVFG